MPWSGHRIEQVCTFTPEMLQRIAQLYGEIWREPPWNEDFWTVEGVTSDIRKEMARPHGGMFVANGTRQIHASELSDDSAGRKPYPSEEERTSLVGFTWGYEVSQADLREISGTNGLDHLFSPGVRVFYVDELGVQRKWRNRGIGSGLSVALLEKARAEGLTLATLRTDMEAHPARAVYVKLGFTELKVQDASHEKRTYWAKELVDRGGN